MLNRQIILLLSTIFFVFVVNGQDCRLTIRGKVIDEASAYPLSFVNVIIQELSAGIATDDDGNFYFENICPGEYHILLSHIGCAPKEINMDLRQDTLIKVVLSHTATSLVDIVVKGKKNRYNNQSNLSVNRQVIEDNTNQNISGLLEKETGVHLIKNGSGISKPVVHGLHGNRLLLLNNGIAQSGQQWGNDHSPEIDPFTADKITVLKGANAIAYGSGNLGSVILVEPKKIGREPHLHGQVNYAYETNGWGSVLNTRLEKYTSLFGWRINGSLKKYGDKKAPDYFLNNTGAEEANLSLQLEKNLDDELFIDFYVSTFNTRIGILRGSHISSLVDLESALSREVPFYTEPDFSYAIDAPYQKVSHHLAKLKAKYFLNDNKWLDLVIAGQLNDRKEFDVRRSGRSDIPALSLKQYTANFDLNYNINFDNNWKLKIGNQNIITDNTNDPETGILPLIPDYISWKSGLFATITEEKEKRNFSLGLRYDYENQNVVSITNSIPREIVRYENNFHNIGAVLGLKFELTETQSLSFNSGYAMRNPAVNELYSNGLHQGVSGIEEGDIDLESENAFKNTLEYKWVINTDFSISALMYFQHFTDYIYLDPQDEVRLTIRGAFPVFKYEQTDANIYGLDLTSQFTISNSLYGLLKYSYIKGDDISNDIPLVFMPPNSLSGSLTYRMNNSLHITSALNLEEFEIELNNRLVFEQKHLLPEQDYVLPPPTYNLIGVKVSANAIFPKHKFRFFTKVDNLLNEKYRDYLNRQRYFADDTGISLTIGINYKF